MPSGIKMWSTLAPVISVWCQAITRTSVDLLSIGPLGTDRAIWTNIQLYLFKKMYFLHVVCKMVILFKPQSTICLFIRPFEKRDVLCRGNVRPSVCPSVCPSVRPSVRVFRTFLQHALRYQFEAWYIHSVGGTTCRVWIASQLGHFDLVYSQK